MQFSDQTRDRLLGSRIESLADQLDAREDRARGQRGAAAPKGMRRYRSKGMMLMAQHPGGGIAKFPAAARFMSATHVTVLLTCFLHTRTPVSMVLRELSGAPVPVRGEVVQCKHVQHAIHEVSVKLDTEIDPSNFVADGADDANAATAAPAAGAVAAVESPIQARVLVIEDDADELRLLKFLLNKAKAEVTTAQTAAAAHEQLTTGTFDLVICDLNLGEDRGEDIIAQARKGGFAGMVMVVSGEIKAARLAALNTLDVVDVVTKPVTPQGIMRAIADALAEGRSGANKPVIVSSMDEGVESEAFLQPFVEAARTIVSDIQQAMQANDAERLSALAVRLKDGAATAGFSRISRAAQQLMATIETSPEPASLGPVVDRLAGLCGRMGLKSAAPVVAAVPVATAAAVRKAA